MRTESYINKQSLQLRFRRLGVAQDDVVWYKVETLDGRIYEELWIGVSTVLPGPCGFMQELEVPYRMYLRGKQIIKLEELN